MQKKFKISILIGLFVILAFASINILSAQSHSKAPTSKNTESPVLLTQANLKGGNITTGDAPIINFPEQEYDFGHVAQNAAVSHIFKVKNIGTAPLKIISAKAS